MVDAVVHGGFFVLRVPLILLILSPCHRWLHRGLKLLSNSQSYFLSWEFEKMFTEIKDRRRLTWPKQWFSASSMPQNSWRASNPRASSDSLGVRWGSEHLCFSPVPRCCCWWSWHHSLRITGPEKRDAFCQSPCGVVVLLKMALSVDGLFFHNSTRWTYFLCMVGNRAGGRRREENQLGQLQNLILGRAPLCKLYCFGESLSSLIGFNFVAENDFFVLGTDVYFAQHLPTGDWSGKVAQFHPTLLGRELKRIWLITPETLGCSAALWECTAWELWSLWLHLKMGRKVLL